MKYLGIILIGLFLSSCVCERQVKKWDKHERKQEQIIQKLKERGCSSIPVSGEIKVVTKIDTLYETQVLELEVPPRFITDTFRVECDEDNEAQLPIVKSQKEGISIEVGVVDGELVVNGNCDSLLIEIEQRNRTIREQQKTIQEDKVLVSDSKQKGFNQGIKFMGLVLLGILLLGGVIFGARKL